MQLILNHWICNHDNISQRKGLAIYKCNDCGKIFNGKQYDYFLKEKKKEKEEII
jgi:ribosomal protein L37AE/L43A